jgi:V/A-type H+/Na+-transporting ATPase subunit D
MDASVTVQEHRFLGVNLLEGAFDAGRDDKLVPRHAPGGQPEPGGGALPRGVQRARAAGLRDGGHARQPRATGGEYIRTERRARALENVVLPEIEGSLRFMDEQLEAMDQEEAIRVRNAAR